MNTVFEPLPPIQRPSRNLSAHEQELARQAAELRARPGEWARISIHKTGTQAGQHAHRVSTAGIAAFRPAGAFEAVSRCVNGEHRVYARYVGDTPAGGES